LQRKDQSKKAIPSSTQTQTQRKMTSISLTSGQILDIITQLTKMADNLDDAENYTLAAYYFNMAQQFEILNDKLQDFIPENRVANLVLAAN
jgi:hypothetical protein